MFNHSNPQLVCWDTNFTPEEKKFKVTFEPQVSKTHLLQVSRGIKLPEDRNRRRVLAVDSDKRNLHLRVTDWNQFVKMATPEQVACVKVEIAAALEGLES